MNTKPILESEYASLRISALPSRPTASSAFGGRGYTATQLKEAFDRLPLLLIERFNRLLEDIGGTGEGSLSAALPTGIEEGHTLKKLFEDVKSGTLATYLSVGGRTLAEALDRAEGTLADMERMVTDARDGTLAGYLTVDGESLQGHISDLRTDIEALKGFAADAESGALASYLRIGESSLTDTVAAIEARLGELAELAADVESGALAKRLTVDEERTLADAIGEIDAAIEALREFDKTAADGTLSESLLLGDGRTLTEAIAETETSLSEAKGSLLSLTEETERIGTRADALDARITALESTPADANPDGGSPADRT